MENPKHYPRIYGVVESINNYVEHRLPPGGFTRAVLENDLKGAMEQADLQNRNNLFEIVKYCYNEIPANCWGGKKEVENWLKTKEGE